MEFRFVQAADAKGVIEAHHNAIRFIANMDYPPEIIDEWAKLPISEKMIENYINQSMKEETTIVANIASKDLRELLLFRLDQTNHM